MNLSFSTNIRYLEGKVLKCPFQCSILECSLFFVMLIIFKIKVVYSNINNAYQQFSTLSKT